MNENNLHRQLNRQVNKFLSEEIFIDNPAIKKFIEAVNQSYYNYEKDAELFNQSIHLNDVEYNEINNRLKSELEKKVNIQVSLIDSIKRLNGDSDIKLDNEGDFLGLLELLQNEIELKKESNNQLLIAKLNAELANEAKSDFLSIMSHEIRTPLNAIIGLLYIMEKEDSIESFHDNLDVLKNSAKNLYLLINNILDYNKIEAGKVDLDKISFDFKELLFEIVKSLEVRALENNNKIEIITDNNFYSKVISDPLRISQIITNLVINAIKFTKNGLIQILINQIDQKDNRTSFKVQVIDNGIGIDPEKFNLIFEKFGQAESKSSRRFDGSGLGLVIVKKLLNLFNSDIELKSELGIGSNFSFVLDLPASIQDSVGIDLLNNYEEKDLSGFRVLLVEDNLINIRVADKILKRWNVEVDIALNGLLGVEKFKSNSYDLILMDLSMPVMDGYEASVIIRGVNTSVPIIALTASTSYLSLEKAIQIGINEYVTKPFIPKELNAKLCKYFNKTMT